MLLGIVILSRLVDDDGVIDDLKNAMEHWHYCHAVVVAQLDSGKSQLLLLLLLQ
jgi:hypothetical protein